MAVRDRSLVRLWRCGAVALASVIVYARRRNDVLLSIGKGTTAAQPGGGGGGGGADESDSRTTQYRRRRRRLDRLPTDSVRRVAFVTFSYARRNDARKLFDFLLPAVDTWAAPPARDTDDAGPVPSPVVVDGDGGGVAPSTTLYVVFSDPSRDPFEELCVDGDEDNIAAERYSLCDRLRPVFVDCPEGRFGESPCCKQQKGLLELFENDDDYPLHDWYAFFDDDSYLRKEYVAKLLAVHRNPDFPMAAIPYSQGRKQIGFGERSCGEKGMDEFAYPWGMPIFYSRGAVEMMAGGYRANSLVEQCRAFNITHDVGNAMLNWMYGLPVAMLPPFQPLPDFRGDFIGSHWAGRDDMRKLLYGEEKRNRRGQVVKPLDEGEFSFYKAHERWMLPKNNHPEDIHKLATVRENRWYPNVTGFRQTLTYAQHGDPQSWTEGKWHTMQISDCSV